MIPPRPISTLFPYTTLFRSILVAPPSVLRLLAGVGPRLGGLQRRSEEHTSELQSRGQLVCRLPLVKKEKVYDAPAESSGSAYSPQQDLGTASTGLCAPSVLY